MLQQTVAASVVPYFEKWCTDYPDIQSLASADLTEVLSHWEGLGYYSRCRNLHKAANYIVDSLSGKLPDSYKELISIPGIGDYTARAILSIAYTQPYAVLDANVRRIIKRLTAKKEWSKELDKSAIAELESIIPGKRPGDFNEAMMQLGQQICTTSSPACISCPLGDSCLGFLKGIAEEIPEKKTKKIKSTEKSVLLIAMNKKILLRRKKRGLFHDLWLIPSVWNEKGRVIDWMEVNWSGMDSIKLSKQNHFYTDNKDILSPLLFMNPHLEQTQLTPSDDDDFEYKWIEMGQLEQYPSPSVYRKILDEALEHL